VTEGIGSDWLIDPWATIRGPSCRPCLATRR
jgi:hypothetical protein